jgi:hypothetical protein
MAKVKLLANFPKIPGLLQKKNPNSTCSRRVKKIKKPIEHLVLLSLASKLRIVDYCVLHISPAGCLPFRTKQVAIVIGSAILRQLFFVEM